MRVYQYVRQNPNLRASAAEVAARIGGDVEDTRLALDELVAQSTLRRFDPPGSSPVYWS